MPAQRGQRQRRITGGEPGARHAQIEVPGPWRPPPDRIVVRQRRGGIIVFEVKIAARQQQIRGIRRGLDSARQRRDPVGVVAVCEALRHRQQQQRNAGAQAQASRHGVLCAAAGTPRGSGGKMIVPAGPGGPKNWNLSRPRSAALT